METIVKQPLTNAQLELLKIFSHPLSENDLADLKKTLVDFFAKRLVQQADKVWDDKNWTDDDIDKILNTKMRKKH